MTNLPDILRLSLPEWDTGAARDIIAAKIVRLASLDRVLPQLVAIAAQPLDLPVDLAAVAARPPPLEGPPLNTGGAQRAQLAQLAQLVAATRRAAADLETLSTQLAQIGVPTDSLAPVGRLAHLARSARSELANVAQLAQLATGLASRAELGA